MQQGTDPWGNRLTYHADSSYSNALFGFDELEYRRESGCGFQCIAISGQGR